MVSCFLEMMCIIHVDTLFAYYTFLNVTHVFYIANANFILIPCSLTKKRRVTGAELNEDNLFFEYIYFSFCYFGNDQA